MFVYKNKTCIRLEQRFLLLNSTAKIRVRVSMAISVVKQREQLNISWKLLLYKVLYYVISYIITPVSFACKLESLKAFRRIT